MQKGIGKFMRINMEKAWIAVGAAIGLSLVGSEAKAQTIPAATISSSQTLLNLSVSYGGHIAVNSVGDIFYVDPGTKDLYELAPGSTTSVVLLTGLSSGARSVGVDPSNNVYVPDTYNGVIIEIPYVSGTYAANTAEGSVGACPASGTPTAPCQQFGGGGGVTGYYFQGTDIGFDTKGDAFISTQYLGAGICSGTCNAIVEFAAPYGNSSNENATLVAGGPGKLPNAPSAELAVDGEGDILYADGTNLYEVAAGTNNAIVVGSGLNSPGGVGVDQFGNFYVSDSGNDRIVEMPTLNGAPQISKQFTVSYTYSGDGVGVGPLGKLYYLGYNNTLSVANLNVLTLYNANFGSSPVGTAATSLTLSVVFSATTMANNIGLASGGAAAGFSISSPSTGACTAGAYSAGSSCSITVSYTPTLAGLQKSALILSGSGASIVTGYLQGIGLGAAQTSDPGTVSAIGGGWKAPAGIAVDTAGNTYISDTTGNAVYEYAPGATTGTSIGMGLSRPSGVAVDGAGDVYIGDSGNGRVVEVPAQNGAPASSAQTVVFTGTSNTTGLGIDGTGSLLIADSGNSRVLRLTNTDGTPNSSFGAVIGTGFKAPVAVVVDNSGNIFVADQTANSVTEVANPTKVQSVVGSGYSRPSGLAVDASGSVYVADPGNQRLVKIPLENGSFNANDEYAVGVTVAAPYGVALDALFNLYVVDNANAAVDEIVRTAGTLNLGKANENTTTSQLDAEIGDAGNQTLKLGTPDYTVAGNTSEFTVTSPSTNGCTNGGNVVSGFACTLAATFTPTTTGTQTDTLTFSDNALNTTSPMLILTGFGENLATTITMLNSSSITPPLGQSVTVTATISSAVSGTPTGTVQFYLNGSANGAPVTVSGGNAQITLNNLNGGTQIVTATYSGDNNYAPNAAMALTITVLRGTTATSLVVTAQNNNPLSTPPGTPVTLLATVMPSAAQAPTQIVTFYANGASIGTAPVVAGTTYTATLVTTAVPTGTEVITATYGGDVNYQPSTSPSVTLIVSPASFLLSPTTASLTLSSGQTGTLQFTVTSIAGYTGNIGLVCSGLPANSVCSFGPNAFLLNPSTPAFPYVPQIVTTKILTGLTPAIPQPPLTGELRMPGGGSAIGLALILLMPLAYRRRRLLKGTLRTGNTLSLLLLSGVGAALVSGCGSNLIGVTAKGNYTVTVTAYGTNLGGTTTTQTAQISLTVQ